MILAHDSLNQEVRRGLEEVPYSEIEKVAFVDLDFVGGYVPAEPPMEGECWGGLALIIVDESDSFGPAHEGRRPRMKPLSELIWPSTEDGDGEIDYRSLAEEMEGSISWRVTAPMRAASARLRGRR